MRGGLVFAAEKLNLKIQLKKPSIKYVPGLTFTTKRHYF